MGFEMRARRVFAAVIGGATALLGAATTGTIVRADTGWSTYCTTNGYKSVEISSNPTIAVAVGGPFNQLTPTVAICYATSADGQSGTGELAGGVIGVTANNAALNPYPDEVDCFSDADAQVQPLCAAQTGPTATWTPAPAPGVGGTLTVTLPFLVCGGSNFVTGVVCLAPQGTPNLAATGLIVSSIAVQGGPSCCPDGVTLTPTTTVYIDGIVEATSASAAAGLNPAAVGAGTGNSSPPPLICITSTACVALPSGWAGTSGAPVAELIVGSTAIPVAPVGQECITVEAPANDCPSPY